ncbi:NAD-dependent epimerase/dehydratase family protein [Anaeromyxobacter diazotrophicus]|uniref:Epimerase n=1 Tax=Anaeromyxobacter diazotrophicus TaxID=2590199 RepID=A0A7I9VS05_9BACT|nr:NAD-dependent epimerase/dehydratase family protein [Anaeromyxobacter diazotrophicus]GEJ59213.1 epimerase [Anaeromyxobacter diazotrophicus]
MRVLVTGATGFIGGALTALLAARGDRVRALVRPSSRTEALSALGAELAQGDVGDPASLLAAVEGCDAVIHLAGAVKALRDRELFQANGEGTRHVVAACAASAARPRLVYVSSLAAAGPATAGRARVEDDPPAPVSRYGESKLLGERAVRLAAGKVAASIVRPPVVYGPGDKELMPQLLRMARLGLVVRAGFQQKTFSVVHVADLGQGILDVLDRGRPVGEAGGEGTYFFEDGADRSWDEIALAACDALGRRARVLALPEAVSAAAAAASSALAAVTRRASILSLDKLREMRQSAWTCSAARARAELGWSPRFPLPEGMADAVRWFQARGLA